MIIGITGTDGGGKGAAVDVLVRKFGYKHFSSRTLIETEITKRNLPNSRANMREVANDMRRKEGNDVLVNRALESIKENAVDKAVIESIRTLAEAHTLKQLGGILLAIDADPRKRYRRIQGRKSASDKVSYEEFIAHEKLEMNDPDPNGMQKQAVMEVADYTIDNNGSMSELRSKVRNFLDKYTA